MSRLYGLYTQTLCQVCGLEDDDTLEVLRSKVRDTIDSLSVDQQTGITNTVEVLLTTHQDPDDSAAPVKGEALKREIYSIMLDIWAKKAWERPLILVLDDLHWTDQSFLELTSHLFQLVKQGPTLFVCAFRPHHDAAVWKLGKDAAQYALHSADYRLYQQPYL